MDDLVLEAAELCRRLEQRLTYSYQQARLGRIYVKALQRYGRRVVKRHQVD